MERHVIACLCTFSGHTTKYLQDEQTARFMTFLIEVGNNLKIVNRLIASAQKINFERSQFMLWALGIFKMLKHILFNKHVGNQRY